MTETDQATYEAVRALCLWQARRILELEQALRKAKQAVSFGALDEICEIPLLKEEN